MSAKSNKYFVIRRIKKLSDLQNFIDDITPDVKRQAVMKRLDLSADFFLIEKTKNVNNTESITNLWTVHDGVTSNWNKYVKGRLMWDYTGIVTVMHQDDRVTPWNTIY